MQIPNNDTPQSPTSTETPTNLSPDRAVEQPPDPGTHLEIIEDDDMDDVPVQPAPATEPHRSPRYPVRKRRSPLRLNDYIRH